MIRPALITGAALLALAPATALAAPVAGTSTEPAGGTDLPQQDIRAIAAAYDPAGSLRGSISFAAVPTFDTLTGVSLYVGRWSTKRGTCEPDGFADVFLPDADDGGPFGGMYFRGDEGPSFDAVAQDATLSFETSGDARFTNRGWNCAWAESFGPAKDGKDLKTNDGSHVFSLTPEAGAGAPGPTCSVPPQRVRRGARLRADCANVGGKLQVRFYSRSRKLRRTVAVKAGARLQVRSRGLRRGRYDMTVWRGSTLIGGAGVKVR